jgi:hypothetical protein
MNFFFVILFRVTVGCQLCAVQARHQFYPEPISASVGELLPGLLAGTCSRLVAVRWR